MQIKNQTYFAVEALPSIDTDNKAILTIIVKGTFSFESPEVIRCLKEQDEIQFADVLYDNNEFSTTMFENDIAPFKPCADIIVVGKAYAPQKIPVSSFTATLQVGKLRKELSIFGHRYWINKNKYSIPEKILEMPIRYENAYGGFDINNKSEYFSENLSGKGFISNKHKSGIENIPLPNIEDSNCLISSYKDKPEKPAGMGVYSKLWRSRLKHAGTFNDDWRKNKSPNMPEDFDPLYYNAAHPDMQINGYLSGNETIILENLTTYPNSRYEFNLPEVSIKTTIIKKFEYEYSESLKKTPDESKEIIMNIDTLCIIPDEKKILITWRGKEQLSDINALEVNKIIIESENSPEMES